VKPRRDKRIQRFFEFIKFLSKDHPDGWGRRRRRRDRAIFDLLGYDNSDMVDSVAHRSERLTVVRSIFWRRMPQTLFENGSIAASSDYARSLAAATKAFDASTLDDPRSFAAWRRPRAWPVYLSLTSLAQVAGVAKRFLGYLTSSWIVLAVRMLLRGRFIRGRQACSGCNAWKISISSRRRFF
jgi:hypothetical protein